MPVDTIKRRSWSGEDLEEELLTACTPKTDSERSASSSDLSKCVRFGECAVRRYSQILGDHPYCSVGCPLELGWKYETVAPQAVDDYEASRTHRRSSSQELRLSPEERRSILSEYTDGEVRRACRKINRDRSDCQRKCQRQVQREFFASSS